MKLLLVTGQFPARSETFIYRKARALASRGHDVTVATRQVGDWSLYPDRLPDNLHVETFVPDHSFREPSRALSAVRGAASHLMTRPSETRALYAKCKADLRTKDDATRQFLRHVPFVERETDVIHFEFLSLGVMYPLVRELTRAPIVVSCRGNDVHTLELQSAAHRESAVRCLREASAIHCVSSEMADEVTRVSGRRDGIWVNRPAVDVDQIAERGHDSTQPPLRFLATGRLVWKKGFEYLLCALAQVAKRGINFVAEIVGGGELFSPLRFSIGDLELENHVKLVGALTSAEVLERMQTTDVFLLSSVEEGISNAVLEAMASGVPIVTTMAGGMAEAVADGIEGFVVPVRDIERMAERIIEISSNEQLRRSMGRAARERAVRDFSLRRQAEVFESIYQSVAG